MKEAENSMNAFLKLFLLFLVLCGLTYLECLAVAWAWNSLLIVAIPALPQITLLQALVVIFVFSVLFKSSTIRNNKD